MGVKRAGWSVSGLTLVLTGAIAFAAPTAEAASRAKTRFDGIRDCERTANLQFRRQNPAFRRFTIDRSHVNSERSAERVGPVFVATVISGRATYEGAVGPRVTKFVCLHGGMHRRALFVYALPD